MADEAFTTAADAVKKLTKKPSDDEMLKVYGLFKQGTVGDCNTAQPGLLDLKGKAKWNAWNGMKGKSQDDAKAEYVSLVSDLQTKYK